MQKLFGSMMPPLRVLILLAIVFSGVGCSADRDVRRVGTRVDIGSGVMLDLPRPGDLGRRISAAQSVIVRYDRMLFFLDTRLTGTPERILIVGLDAAGRRAMTVSWTDSRITAETAPWFPDPLSVNNLLADLVMIYWPIPVVRASLTGSGVRLEAGPGYRSIVQNGEEVIRIDYEPSSSDAWTGTVHYRNIVRGYTVDGRSVEVPE